MHDNVWQQLSARLPPLGAGSNAADAASGSGTGLSSAGAASNVGMLTMIVKAAAIGSLLGTSVMTGKYIYEANFSANTRSASPVAVPSARPRATPSTSSLSVEKVPLASGVAESVAEKSRASSPAKVKNSPLPTLEAEAHLDDIVPGPPNVAVPHASPRQAPNQTAAIARAAAEEESGLIATARNSLRGGNASAALTLLEGARERYPNGILTQEREALTIEALLKTAQRDAANARAEAFLRTYPRSPHIARVRALIAAP
jgi:hypothetical protein